MNIKGNKATEVDNNMMNIIRQLDFHIVLLGLGYLLNHHCLDGIRLLIKPSLSCWDYASY